MSTPLKRHELKYSQMEKHAFTIVKVVKQFRYYILHSHCTIFIPKTAVKSILTQKEIGMNNRAVWIEKIQEYDLMIKPTNLVRGKGLCKLIVEDGKLSEKIDEVPMALLVSLTDP